MHADLDTLCTVIYCTADDLLPEARANARRRVTDAELVTLCVAQAIMGIPSDRRFLAAAAGSWSISSRSCPGQPAYWKRRRRLADAIEWLLGVFASRSPGCRGRPPAHRLDPGALRRQPRDGQTLGPRRGRRLRLLRQPTRAGTGAFACTSGRARRTPRALTLADPARGEREVALELLGTRREVTSVLVCDKGYAGRAFAAGRRRLGVLVVRPQRADEPGSGPHLAPIRQRIESIFWTCKDLSRWSATGRAPWRACASASSRGSSAWPPASASTTSWAGRAGHSSTTAPEAAGVESII